MNTNAQKMTLEEKLVQHIKEVGLGALIQDEDAITELTRRAVTEALIQPRKLPNPNGYGYKEDDSPVVEAARAIAKQAVERVLEKEIVKLMEDPKIMLQIREAFALMAPKILEQKMYDLYDRMAIRNSLEATRLIQEAFSRIPR